MVMAVHGLILLAPIVTLLFLRIYQTHLLHQTEAALIAESVWVGEVYRDALAAELGPGAAASPRPPGSLGDFYPQSPQWDETQPILPRLNTPERYTPAADRVGPNFRAGARLGSLLDRAKRVTLSGVRVIDTRGVVVATSGGELGAYLDDLPEVRGALAGRYTVIGRERVSDEPTPPLDGIRRRGRMRLFTAMPVFADGHVIAVVRLSRTGIDVIEALFVHRTELLEALLLCLAVTTAVTLALSRAIGRPVRDLMEAAAAIDRDEPRRPFRARGFVPRELFALSESLDALTRKLTERAEYVAAFAAQAGHELKTPLTAIRGAVELLADGGDDMPAEVRARFLQNVRTDTDRMERLVFRLLALARLESALSLPEPEAVDLSAWLGALRDRHAPRIRLALAPDLPTRLSIPLEHLEDAVMNLVDNALRHGGEAPVTLSAGPRRGAQGEVLGVTLSVTDHGPGISEAQQRRLFERFYTTERARGGTGLGLAIVAAIAKTRGGTVSVESRPGETTFTVGL